MANPTYTTQNIQSNILAYEELKEYGFCRKEFTVDNTAGTLRLGSVLYRTVAPDSKTKGDWTEVTATALGDGTLGAAQTTIESLPAASGGKVELAVLIGTNNLGEALNTSQADITVAAAVKVLLLVRGTAILRKPYLVYQGTQSDANATLLAGYIESLMEQVVVVDAATPFTGAYADSTAIVNVAVS